jgi:hypothetical protein
MQIGLPLLRQHRIPRSARVADRQGFDCHNVILPAAGTFMRSRKKTVNPIGLQDITIVDDAKMRKAITAAALGNAMEWFDFGVYGFVAYALGKIFFPGADPSVQMIAALATFSVPFLIRPIGGVFFGAIGDKYGRQKVLAATIVIMSLSTFAIGLIPSYESIGIRASRSAASTPAPRSSSPNTRRTVNAVSSAAGWTSALSPVLSSGPGSLC